MLPRLSLVLGGAASGKSALAENLLTSSGLGLVYVATARCFDAEMGAKIKIHKQRRNAGWETLEAPDDIGETLAGVDPARAVLLDCATMWLTNYMLDDRPMTEAVAGFIRQISMCPAPLVIVSNELGQGIVPDNPMAREFRETHGRLNIAIAQKADSVVQVVAGLPNVLKGALP